MDILVENWALNIHENVSSNLTELQRVFLCMRFNKKFWKDMHACMWLTEADEIVFVSCGWRLTERRSLYVLEGYDITPWLKSHAYLPDEVHMQMSKYFINISVIKYCRDFVCIRRQFCEFIVWHVASWRRRNWCLDDEHEYFSNKVHLRVTADVLMGQIPLNFI